MAATLSMAAAAAAAAAAAMSAFDRAAEMGRMLSEDAQFAYILSVDVGWPDSTWADARQICEDEGLSFAKILSQEDQNKMRFKLRGSGVLYKFDFQRCITIMVSFFILFR